MEALLGGSMDLDLNDIFKDMGTLPDMAAAGGTRSAWEGTLCSAVARAIPTYPLPLATRYRR